MGRPKGSKNTVAVKRKKRTWSRRPKVESVLAKVSSPDLSKLAARCLSNPKSATTDDVQSLAGSVLSQFEPHVVSEALVSAAIEKNKVSLAPKVHAAPVKRRKRRTKAEIEASNGHAGHDEDEEELKEALKEPVSVEELMEE